MKNSIVYAVATLFLLFTEILIALYVHDEFIRPYVGDVLVVLVLYTLIRIFLPKGCRFLPLWIFLFAVGVELLQLADIVELLGMGDNRFLRIMIGAVFDVKDIVCYAVGCILLGLYEWLGTKRKYMQ